LFALACVCVLAGPSAAAQRAPLEIRYADPYLGAIVVDADTGQVLFADNPDTKGYPASVLKLMDLLIILEKINQGAMRLDEKNAADLIAGYDFIVDGSDNFATKFLVNDAAVALGKAFSHAGIVRLQGQTMTVIPGKGACYRCLFKDPPAPGEILNCQQAGILGAIAGTIGSIQATEAIKYLIGMEEELLVDRLLTYDATAMRFHTIEVRRDPRCGACGDNARGERKLRSMT